VTLAEQQHRRDRRFKSRRSHALYLFTEYVDLVVKQRVLRLLCIAGLSSAFSTESLLISAIIAAFLEDERQSHLNWLPSCP
jgi:hypothetical protein